MKNNINSENGCIKPVVKKEWEKADLKILNTDNIWAKVQVKVLTVPVIDCMLLFYL